MISKEELIKDIKMAEAGKMSVKKFYKDLDEAIKTQNRQSIYRLSKIITRYRMN